MTQAVASSDLDDRPIGPATALFHRLEQAIERRDYSEALKVQRELRKAGFSVCYTGQKSPERTVRR